MITDKRPITVEDLYNYALIESPRVSPDGNWIAFVRVQADRFANRYKRNIWLVSTDGSEPIQLTRSDKDYAPRWLPDGNTLGFISSRGDKPQVFLLPIGFPGGEARAVTSMLNGVASFSFSPDGEQIAFTSAMNTNEREQEDSDEPSQLPMDELDVKQRKTRHEHDEKRRLDPYPMRRIPYRAGTSFVGDRNTQIYIMSVNADVSDEDKKPRRLTNVNVDHNGLDWSPDGRSIFTARAIDPDADEPFRQYAVFRVSIAEGKSEQVTDDTHSCFSPLVSPDGKWVAITRYPRRNSMSEHITRLAVFPAGGGEARDLNLALDQSALSVSWDDSVNIVFNSWTRGTGPINRVDVTSGEISTLVDGDIKTIEVHSGKDGAVAFTAGTFDCPTELYYLPAGADQPQRLTFFNQAFIDEIIIREHHEMVYTSPDGNEVQGWYILPTDYEEGKTYPLALNIHGGPHQMWGPSEPSMFHEWQLHAAQGYVVFYCNPRGSDGYGEAYSKALHGAWGTVAYKDVMAGVDALLEKGFVDERRMAVTGGSYGGYMTAWILGHTDRFVSAVSQRGVYNLSSFYGTSDVPSLISGEYDVEPWEDHALLWEHSPLAYAHKMKTPLLLIHAENDYRVPIEQAEQLFAFVRRSGGTVEMLRYPRDGHELSRSGEPYHRVSRLEHMVNWFNKYCKI